MSSGDLTGEDWPTLMCEKRGSTCEELPPKTLPGVAAGERTLPSPSENIGVFQRNLSITFMRWAHEF